MDFHENRLKIIVKRLRQQAHAPTNIVCDETVNTDEQHPKTHEAQMGAWCAFCCCRSQHGRHCSTAPTMMGQRRSAPLRQFCATSTGSSQHPSRTSWWSVVWEWDCFLCNRWPPPSCIQTHPREASQLHSSSRLSSPAMWSSQQKFTAPCDWAQCMLHAVGGYRVLAVRDACSWGQIIIEHTHKRYQTACW